MLLEIGQTITGSPMILTGEPNSHICIIGMSGTGKTTLAHTLTLSLVDNGAHTFIFDFTGDHLDLQQLEGAADVQVLNMRDANISLPILEPEYPEDTAADIADRLIALLQSRLKFGDSQWAYLSELIIDGLESNSIHAFDDIVALVEAEEVQKNVATRLLPKLRALNRILPKGSTPVTWKLDMPGITIFDLHRISDPSSLSILVELLVGSICGNRMNNAPTDAPPVYLIIDELHRLKLTETSNISRLLREGRKYNLHGIFSTQWIRTRTEASMLEQAAAQIFFRIGDREAASMVRQFSMKDKRMLERYRTLLSSMPRGQFLLKYNNRFYLSKAPRITRSTN